MIEVRPAAERGHADHGWLVSAHSFSFADYHDPRHMGFGPLRVINEDRVAPGKGFGTHGHRDMEIISYVLSGSLGHQDSLGNGSSIRPGDVQRMTAGTGVRHAEFNHDKAETTHFLQIWIEPDRRGLPPSYEDRHFPDTEKRGRLRLIASPDGRDGSVVIHQQAEVHAGLFNGDERAELTVEPGRRIYVHVARGDVVVNDRGLGAGDALKMTGEPSVVIGRGRDAELLIFVLPG